MEQLKQTTLWLAMPQNISKHCPKVGSTIFASLSEKMGIEEPVLVKLLKYLLSVHTKWFQNQHCSDP